MLAAGAGFAGVLSRANVKSGILGSRVGRFLSVKGRHDGEELVKVRYVNEESGKFSGVVVASLNDPRRFNALSERLGDAFEKTMQSISQEKSLRALVITGEGKAFTAGGDLDFLQARIQTSPTENIRVMLRFYERFLSIRRVPVPTIAAINGPAVGAGFGLALACDIRLAAAEVKMGVNFARLGIPPGMATSHYLPKLTNTQVASKLLLTGDLISAEEALQLGLILSVEPRDQILDKAIGLAKRIATASPISVRATTQTLRAQLDVGLEQSLIREADTQARCYAANDLIQGLAALKNKTEPVFSDII